MLYSAVLPTLAVYVFHLLYYAHNAVTIERMAALKNDRPDHSEIPPTGTPDFPRPEPPNRLNNSAATSYPAQPVPLTIPRVALVVIQRRGVINLPVALRETFRWSEGQRALVTAKDGETITLTAALGPDALFARHDGRVTVPDSLKPSEALPRRWLDPETVLRAQAWPDSPQRDWFIRCDGGFVSARLDPSLLPDALAGLGQLLPDLDRATLALYMQTILTWTGITLADRAFYFVALLMWGADDTITWSEAVQRGRDAE